MHVPTVPDPPTDSADQAVVRHALQRGLISPPAAREIIRERDELRRHGHAVTLLGLLQGRGVDPRHLAELERVWQESCTRHDTRVDTRGWSARMQRESQRLVAQAPPEQGEDPGGAPGPAREPRQGEQVGPFAVESELARGGLGIVYVARDARLSRRVALKLLRPELLGSPKDVERLRLEAEAAARLRHPNIVGVHEVGQSPHGMYLALDLIDGPSLKTVLEEKGPFEPTVAARIAERLGRALHYAHSRAILHRDVKPHNVLLDAAGEPHLTDFGLAKDVEANDRGVTATGQVVGTPAYMAPEQAQGDLARIDRRSDVWGLGATLYALLAGQAPFQGSTAMSILHQVIKAEPRLPSQLRRGIDRDLETIVLKCLEKEPERRYATCELLADDLLRWLRHEPILARRQTALERWRRWVRRNRAFAAVSGAALLLLLLSPSALAVGLVWQRNRTHGELAERASDEAERAWNSLQAISKDDLAQRTGQALAALQAAERWRALDSGPAAVEAHRRAALALGEVALKSQQWHLAEQAFLLARGGSSDAETDARLKATQAERTATQESMTAEVRGLLEKAGRQELGQPGQPKAMDALFTLVGWRDPTAVRLLATALDEVTEDLRRASEDVYLAGVAPGPERSDLESSLKRRWAAAPGEPLADDVRRNLAAAEERARWAVVSGRANKSPPPFQEILAGHQRQALRPGRRDVARLAAEALGRMRISDVAVPALCRYLEVEADEVSAGVAAEALGRLGGAEAEQAVARARERFSESGPFARRAAEAIASASERGEQPLDAEGLVVRAAGRIARQDWAGAFADANQVIASRPEMAEAWAIRASARLGQDDLRGALEDLNRALDLDATSFNAVQLRGEARRRLGDLEGAFTDLTQALKIQPDTASVHNNRGMVRRTLGDPQGALADFSRALELDPTMALAWCNRGELRLASGDLATARIELERALELDPRLGSAWMYRGRLRLAEGDGVGALDDLGRAIDLEPNHGEHWNTRGCIRERLGDFAGAFEDYDQAIRREPNHVTARYNRAGLYDRGGKRDAAEKELDVVLRMDPRHVNALILRGMIRSQRGDWRAGMEDWERAVQLDPRNTSALVNRADVMRRFQKDYQASIAEAGKALEVDPRCAEAYLVRGFSRHEQGDKPGAIHDIERFLELMPDANAELVAKARRILDELRAR